MKITDEEQLIQLAEKNLKNSTSKTIKIFAGHIPLLYNTETDGEVNVKLDDYRWGLFSTYTFKLGCKLLRYSLDIGKKGKLILLVDDNIELPRIQLPNGTIKRKDENKFRKPRKRLMKSSELPESYEKILAKYQLSQNDLVNQNRDNTNTVLISEKILKEEGEKKFGLSHNECSLAYKSLLLNTKYFNIDSDFLVSFMPLQCKGNICDVLGESLKVNSNHFFFPDINEMGGLVELKDKYINSTKRTPFQNKNELFREGLVSYRADEIIK